MKINKLFMLTVLTIGASAKLMSSPSVSVRAGIKAAIERDPELATFKEKVTGLAKYELGYLVKIITQAVAGQPNWKLGAEEKEALASPAASRIKIAYEALLKAVDDNKEAFGGEARLLAEALLLVTLLALQTNN